ncbi:hypothetical protein [Candidatus Mycoplasma haematohominis]|uniref:Uncharacterized protein n=1 Tax=Candidatus Mycoplasma haematohominis TaxID=1494318 RepID=A0A478FR35_9MOLU|nr:hypothetical protein [Candidatus Mycoplasma haemohominis]GCE64011.1 hypothetical protein MHSWG343_10190 [Candidatus Mycoplasma haemohominis]
MDPLKAASIAGAGTIFAGATGYGVYKLVEDKTLTIQQSREKGREEKKTSESGNSYGAGTWGEQFKDKLMAINAEENKDWWIKKQSEFFGTVSPEKHGTGQSATDTTLNFKQLYSDKSTKHSTADALKNKCKEVYEMTYTPSTDTNKVKEKEVFKFCSKFEFNEEKQSA